jgi:hypothetical protein
MKTTADKRTARILADSAAIRGIARQEHFAAGGTLAGWRGVHTCTPNGKAKASKNACRGKAW